MRQSLIYFCDETLQNEFLTKSCTQLNMQECLILKFEILNGNFEPIIYFQVVDNNLVVLFRFNFKIYPKMKSRYEDYYTYLMQNKTIIFSKYFLTISNYIYHSHFTDIQASRKQY